MRTRVQPILSDDESQLLDRMATLTGVRRTDVVKNALAVYRWFVRETLGGARVVSKRATGEEIVLETPELATVGSKAGRLEPRQLGLLAKRLAETKDANEASRIRERIMRGFYGI